MENSSRSLLNPKTLIVIFIALCVLQRLGLIYFGYSSISHPYLDEPVGGTLSYDLVEGNLRAPLLAYQYETRSGDVLIEGLMLAPLFKVFGRSMFTMKFLAMLSSLACLLIWVTLLKRHCSVWAAVLFAALFAFPPPMFARLNVIGTLSSHHMINSIVALQILLLLEIFRQDTKQRLWLWVALGITAGFGSYTFYSYIIFNGLCFLFLVVFRLNTISLRKIILFAAGGLIGFLPWILRSVYSPGGGIYLKNILRNLSFSLWPFLQGFGFTVPHSLGYGYPSREIGIVSIAFCLFLLVLTGIILKQGYAEYQAGKEQTLKQGLRTLSPAILLALFVALFPFFFIICVSLSPMHINPFEYWQNCGLFATFKPIDAVRYRWFHILYPFYLALCAICTVRLFMHAASSKSFLRYSISGVLILFFCINIVKYGRMIRWEDRGKIATYKAYHFDLYASRFILSDYTTIDFNKSLVIAENYPEENQGEINRCLGTKLTLSLLKDPGLPQKLDEFLMSVAPEHLDDLIFGIVRTIQNIPEEQFRPVQEHIAAKYPEHFYKHWGFRYLAYKYYTLLLNREKLFTLIPAPEQWFFQSFLKKFNKQIIDEYTGVCSMEPGTFDTAALEACLMNEINAVPAAYRNATVWGIGKFVGAEMLFDTLESPDYPLDSSFGTKLPQPMQEAFYRGIGAGFAETLCRHWRRLMPPESVTPERYTTMLEVEWQRCRTLMEKLPPDRLATIEEGFKEDLKARNVNQAIKNFITSKV